MKMIFEVGDRVELGENEYLLDMVGVTGTVTDVRRHDDDDDYTVRFTLDNPPKNRAQGYGVLCSAKSLKYLEPENPREIGHELRKVLTKMGENISMPANSSHEGIFRYNAKQALKALWLVANMDDYVNADTTPEVNRPVVELKKKLIAKLTEDR